MREMVPWILVYEKDRYGNDGIFLSGANGRDNAATPDETMPPSPVVPAQSFDEMIILKHGTSAIILK